MIDFNEAFASIGGANQVLAVSQVVYTTAAFLTPSQVPSPAVQVTFEIDHQTIAVPVASGAFVERPVTVADYLSLAPGELIPPTEAGSRAELGGLPVSARGTTTSSTELEEVGHAALHDADDQPGRGPTTARSGGREG